MKAEKLLSSIFFSLGGWITLIVHNYCGITIVRKVIKVNSISVG